MRVAMFYHSLVSDWNHGNAHFLRGVALEFAARGHELRIFEPEDSWSRQNLVRAAGDAAVLSFHTAFPDLSSTYYAASNLHMEEWLDGVEIAIVHEWNGPELIAAAGEFRKTNPGLRLFFHDTHHRALTAREELAKFALDDYDGVLAYGASLKDAYERLGWGRQVFVWHEAADIRTFYPRTAAAQPRDLVWIGNWGDGERTQELREFLLGPVKDLGLTAQVYGVRYPEAALRELEDSGISYGGWLPNFEAPIAFAQFRTTIHVPRRPYARELPGIPTIRPFEALACGIPLVSAPWDDTEELFRGGEDFLMARNGLEMQDHLRNVLSDPELAAALSARGLETIRTRHTCAHRVDELLSIYNAMKPESVEAISPVGVSR
ncbi:MAG: glycosyltransferase [Acidobacteriaceae bacterium]|nr:glycosyltransferase [Acidobacteriaceae bacterium]